MSKNEHEQLKNQLEKIRSDYNRATRVLRNIEVFGIEDFAIQFKEWKINLLNETNGVDAVWSWINNYEKKIKDSKDISNKSVEEIKNNLEEVNSNIEEMQISYEKFLEIKGKIENSETNIQNLSDNAKQLKNDIEALKTQSNKILESIKELFEKAQVQIANMQSAYDKFLEIKGKIEDEDNGLEAIFNFVKNLKTKSQALNREIQVFRDESNTYLGDIKKNKDEADTLKGDIETLFEDSKTITDKKIDEIEKITSLITDTGFANAFHAQSKKLNIGRIIWGILFLLGVILLSIFLYSLFIDNSGESNKLLTLGLTDIFYRLSLTSPLLLLIAFSMSQYSRETKLNDKYEFKAVTASSISHHIEFLQKKFPNDNNIENQNIILNFVVDTFVKIYKEPYEVKDNKSIKKLEEKIENISKNNKDNIDIEKIIESSKELKELFTDDDLLKKILNFFSKTLK